MGIFKGNKKYILVKTTPIVQPQRKYPVHLKDELKKELHQMEKMSVIKKMNEPTEWVNVNAIASCRKRSGELRICLDPKPLIQQEVHQKNIL